MRAVATALAPDTVAIDRIRLRGGASPAAVQAQLLALPAPAMRQWVFVPRLSVRAPAWRLGQAVARALDRAASDPEAVVFAGFAELAVAYGRDLLAGRADTRWWWRTLVPQGGRSAGEAAVALLLTQPLAVWEALEAWRSEGILSPLWRDMPPSAAQHLTNAVAQETRLAVPPMNAPSSRAPPSLSRNAPAFWAGTFIGAGSEPAVLHTAAFLSVLRWAPIELRRAGAAGVVTAVAELIAAAAPLTSKGDADIAAEPGSTTDAASTPQIVGAAADADYSKGSRPGVADPASPRGAADPGGAPLQPVPERRPVAELREAGSGVDAPPDAAGATENRYVRRELRTAYGGVLFLINVLNRLRLTERLVAWLGATAPSGWQVLADFAARLGLPEDDPLAAFLAETIAETMEKSSEIGELVANLLAEATTLYETVEIWPGFVRQPALLLATPTHLDLELEASIPDIMVRRAGLDLDPGWVPWLGHVVRFHYPRIALRWSGQP